jgi:hypothetical protein
MLSNITLASTITADEHTIASKNNAPLIFSFLLHFLMIVVSRCHLQDEGISSKDRLGGV